MRRPWLECPVGLSGWARRRPNRRAWPGLRLIWQRTCSQCNPSQDCSQPVMACARPGGGARLSCSPAVLALPPAFAPSHRSTWWCQWPQLEQPGSPARAWAARLWSNGLGCPARLAHPRPGNLTRSSRGACSVAANSHGRSGHHSNLNEVTRKLELGRPH